MKTAIIHNGNDGYGDVIWGVGDSADEAWQDARGYLSPYEHEEGFDKFLGQCQAVPITERLADKVGSSGVLYDWRDGALDVVNDDE